jgi:uncharacterized protein with PQ loop repeat
VNGERVMRRELASADLGPGVTFKLKGEDEEREKASAFLLAAFGTAIFLIFAILLAQFNRLTSVGLVLSAVILSTIGVLLGLMLLCGSANRAKSWSCEHCENWKSIKDKNICLSCYWAYPEKYGHVAMRQIRRIDLVWQGEEVARYDKLKEDAAKSGLEIPQFVKEVLAKVLK